MDSLVRAFWWGHEHGERKLHKLKWDKICQPRCRGGLGIKKFNIMNQALFANQFWRITRNPNSLLAQTCKAKFHPDAPNMSVPLSLIIPGSGRVL